jgi:hypothetical protein
VNNEGNDLKKVGYDKENASADNGVTCCIYCIRKNATVNITAKLMAIMPPNLCFDRINVIWIDSQLIYTIGNIKE